MNPLVAVFFVTVLCLGPSRVLWGQTGNGDEKKKEDAAPVAPGSGQAMGDDRINELLTDEIATHGMGATLKAADEGANLRNRFENGPAGAAVGRLPQRILPPGGFEKQYREALDRHFGPGTMKAFDTLLMSNKPEIQARKNNLSSIMFGSGKFAVLAEDAEKQGQTVESPPFQKDAKATRHEILVSFKGMYRLPPGVIDGTPEAAAAHAKSEENFAQLMHEMGQHGLGPGDREPGGGVGDKWKDGKMHSGAGASVVKEVWRGIGDNVIGKIFNGPPGSDYSIDLIKPRNVGPYPGPGGNPPGGNPPGGGQHGGPANTDPVDVGNGQLQNGDPEHARDSFTAGINQDPYNSAAWSGRAQAGYRLGDYASASRDARAALYLDPEDEGAFGVMKLSEDRVSGASRSRASGASGEAKGLGATFAAGLEMSAPSGSAQLAMSRPEAVKAAAQTKQAEQALRVGDYAAALDLATRAVEANPNNAQAQFYRAVASGNMHRYADALAAADAGLKAAPGNLALLNAKSFALNRLKQYKDALAASEAALGINPRDASALANRAHALGGLGDRAGMLENLKLAASIDQRFQPSLDSALQMPSDSDLMFLFPGETVAAPRQSGVVPEGRQGRSLWNIGMAVVGVLFLTGILVFAAGSRRADRTAALPSSGTGPFRSGPSAPGDVSQASTLLRDKYEIVRQIGAGGMGVVFEGLDRSLRRKVAIKKMRDEIRLDRKERERFLAEAKTVAALHHPNIVDIYSILDDGGDVYLVFEYVSGGTLHQAVSRDGPISLGKAVPLFQGIAAALDFAHGRGVIHRDLKPSNIMVDEEDCVKVMDFGVARAAKDAAVKFSMTNTVMGTPPYMAPEAESGVVRKESDVYAMAICLYEALTGRQPFAGMGAGMLLNKMNQAFTPATQAAPGLPPGVDAVFSRAFAADPEKRFATAGEMMRAVEAVAAGTTRA